MGRRSDAEIRAAWDRYRCREGDMVLIPFGPDRIRVAPETADAWTALAAVMGHHGYVIRTPDTDSYNCRKMKGSEKHSLHGYGIALDVNWNTNPYLRTPDRRAIRFCDRPTQAERAESVRIGSADTDMPPAMLADIEAIRTVNGAPVFEWGGRWKTIKDAMHFEIDCLPEDLATGIDTATVAGGLQPLTPELAGSAAPELLPPLPLAHEVIARTGLKLRGGPGTGFGVLRLLPAGTRVAVLKLEGDWAQVDLQGDRLADGFVSATFLREVPAVPAVPAVSLLPDILDRVTPQLVRHMFPGGTSLAAIERHLPHVAAGLRGALLGDREMVLMAMGTIRAETEGFVPISEGISRYNTSRTPFDLYDHGTRIGANLGNSQPGDGARFKGRGFVQLTGRFNYARIGTDLGVDLVGNPELANDPVVAGRILAAFLKRVESRVRNALAARNLAEARRAVNGGSHGLDRFADTFTRGEQLI
jgi:hypothetical protein